jgi:hypothetical protein
MKKVSIFSIIALMAILILSYGCKKEEDKVLNVISVAGNTEATYNTDYIPNEAFYSGPFDADCNTTLYRSDIYISFETDAQLGITFFHPTNSTTIPTGTFTLAADYCMEGFIADFYPTAWKNGGLCLSTGTIKVAKTGDIYDVDINLVIDADCGGGTIKGNFHGTLDPGVN